MNKQGDTNKILSNLSKVLQLKAHTIRTISLGFQRPIVSLNSRMSNCYWQDLVERVSLGGKDYCTENVPGDGNCYFHCISAYAYGNTSHSREYRREVCITIFNDWEQWEHKVGQDICTGVLC